MNDSPSNVCWICGRTIALEDCKVDECGLPVHGDCYFAKVAWKGKKNIAPEADQTLQPETDSDDFTREA